MKKTERKNTSTKIQLQNPNTMYSDDYLPSFSPNSTSLYSAHIVPQVTRKVLRP